MKTFFAAALTVMAASFAMPQGGQPQISSIGIPQTSGIAVQGTVRQSNSSAVISGALVTMIGTARNPSTAGNQAGATAVNRTETSDNAGHFAFKEVAQGNYILSFKAEGYVALPEFQQMTLTVNAVDQSRDINAALIPLGSVSGVIHDPNGQPMNGAQIMAVGIVYDMGRRALRTARQVTADERGVYRIFGLEPGQYYIRAEARGSFAQRGAQANNQIRTYFPGAIDPALATPVDVNEGADLPGKDFNMQTAPTYKISGRVIGQIPNPRLLPDGGPNLSVTALALVPRNTPIDEDPVAFVNALTTTGLRGGPQPGEFEIRNVRPGSYDLYPFLIGNANAAAAGPRGAQAGAGITYTGRTQVDVIDKDVTTVVATVGPGVDLKVQITTSGAPPTGRGGAVIPFSQLQLMALENIPNQARASFAFGSALIPDASGAMTIPNVPPGRYSIIAPFELSRYIADIRMNGQSVLDSGLTIAPDAPGNVEILLKSGGGAITGTAQTKDRKPAANTTVVLVPQQPHRAAAALYRTARTTVTGAFSIRSIAPGQYKAFAWDRIAQSITSGEYLNAEFLSRYETQGTPVTVSEAGSETLTLDVISRGVDAAPRLTVISGGAGPQPPSTAAPLAAVGGGNGSITVAVGRAGSTDPVPNVQVSMTALATVNLPATDATEVLAAAIRDTLGVTLPATATREELIAAASAALAASRQTLDAVTDSNGRFSYVNLRPGRYSIRIQREGYFGPTIARGGRVAPQTALNAAVIITADQPAQNVSFELIPGGVITGRVLDASGRPVPNVNITSLRSSYAQGQWRLASAPPAPARTFATNDRGEFRIAWLAPGEYYLAASVSPVSSLTTAGFQSYSRTFFPGVTEAREAAALHLSDGAEVIADLHMRPSVLYSVSGKASYADGSPADVTMMFMVKRGGDDLDATQTPMFPNGTMPRGSGGFSLKAESGLYDLYTLVRNEQGYLSGRTPVTVINKDVENVAVAVRPGADVRVRVTVDGGAVSGAALPRMGIEARDPLPPLVGTRAATAAVDPDGTFTFTNVPESRYNIQAPGGRGGFGGARGTYVADVREAGTSVLKEGFIVGTSTPGIIDVIVKTDGGTVQGIIAGADGKPLADATVVMVPAQEFRANSIFYPATQTNAQGRFLMPGGVMPGSYKLFAWESVEAGAWENAAFLSKYEEQGRAITVEPNGQLDIQASVIHEQ